jgi:hypothetical protein
MGWPSAPPCGDLARVQTSCLAWLGRHLDDILKSELAADFGREILDWWSALASRARAGQRMILLEARCPGHGCGQRMLTWTEGTDRVECGNRDCQSIFTKTAYDELAAAQVEQHKKLFHGGGECNCRARASQDTLKADVQTR